MSFSTSGSILGRPGPRFFANTEIRARFENEAVIQGGLTHENIGRATDLIDGPECVAIVMDRFDGGSMDELIASNLGGLTWQSAEQILVPVMRAIEAAHCHGIVHRDLKPANIMLDSASDPPVPKVVDFGIAKVLHQGAARTRAGTVMATPAFMPPEQLKGATDVDGRADVYALGAIAYTLWTGRLPYEGGTEYEVTHRVLSGDRPTPASTLNPSLPPAVGPWLDRAMAFERAGRFADVGELRAALERIVPAAPRPAPSAPAPTPAPVAAPTMFEPPPPVTAPTMFEPPPPSTAPRAPVRDWIWVVVGLLVALGVGATLLLWPGGKKDPKRGGTRSKPPPAATEAPPEPLPANVVIALDVSKSMMAEDAPRGTRLQTAQALVDRLLKELTGYRVALVPFAGSPYTQTPLTTDHDMVRAFAAGLRVEDMPTGGTRIGEALQHALTLLPSGDASGVVVLVTDGGDHGAIAGAVADAYAAMKVPIVAIGIGSQSTTARIPVISSEGKRVGWVQDDAERPVFEDLQMTLLEQLAGASGGRAISLADIPAAAAQIADVMGQRVAPAPGGHDAVLALDMSASMNAVDASEAAIARAQTAGKEPPSRFERAREAIIRFIGNRSRSGGRVGLVLFGGGGPRGLSADLRLPVGGRLHPHTDPRRRPTGGSGRPGGMSERLHDSRPPDQPGGRARAGLSTRSGARRDDRRPEHRADHRR